ncbi:MAG: hypothetical protein ACJAZ2_000467 [Glaciecola sp.]|jgi:hypothetical protein
MIPFLKVKSSIKCKLLIGVTAVLYACSSSSKVNDVQIKISAEELSNQLEISLPQSFKGVGFQSGEDALGFKKDKKDGSVKLSFEDLSGLGIKPKEFQQNEEPDIISNCSERISLGTEIIFYFNNKNGMTDLNGNGVVYFLIDGTFKEVLYVNYKSNLYNEVESIVESIVLSKP